MNGSDRLRIVLRPPGKRPATSAHGPRSDSDGSNISPLLPSRFLFISFTIAEVGPPRKIRAVVIGSGPNGLAAAIELARAGLEVTVHEAAAQIGGGARSAELTLPGFVHDICSAVHPMAISSPCFEQYPLHAHGLEWIQPEVPLAHPLDDGTAVVMERSIEATCANLGADGQAWRRLLEPLAAGWSASPPRLLGPATAAPPPILDGSFRMGFIRSARALAESFSAGLVPGRCLQAWPHIPYFRSKLVPAPASA